MDGSTRETSQPAFSPAHQTLQVHPKRSGAARCGRTKQKTAKRRSANTRRSSVSADAGPPDAAFGCDQCRGVRFPHRDDLMRHHELEHGFVARRSTLQFLSRSAFESWRERQEQKHQVRYLPSADKEELTAELHLVCSGTADLSTQEPSHPSKQGGLPCFANMVVAENTKSGFVTLNCQESHHGHQEVGQQRAVIEKFPQGVCEADIFTEAHNARQELLCFPTTKSLDGTGVGFDTRLGQILEGTGPPQSSGDHSYYVASSTPKPSVGCSVAPSATDCSALAPFTTGSRCATDSVFFSPPGPAAVAVSPSLWCKANPSSSATTAPTTACLTLTSLGADSCSVALLSRIRTAAPATTSSDKVAPSVTAPRLGLNDCSDLTSLPADVRSTDEAVHLLADPTLKSSEGPAEVPSSVEVVTTSSLSPPGQPCIVEYVPWPQAGPVAAPSGSSLSTPAADPSSSAETLLLSIGSAGDLATVDVATDAGAAASEVNLISIDNTTNASEEDVISLSSTSEDESQMSVDSSDGVSRPDRMRVTTLTKTLVALVRRLINKDWIDTRGANALLRHCGEMHHLLNAYPDKEIPIFPPDPKKRRRVSSQDDHDYGAGPLRKKPSAAKTVPRDSGVPK